MVSINMFSVKYKETLFIFCLVLVLFTFLFGSLLGAGYILDDHSVIENREELRNFSAVYKSFSMSWHQNQPQQGNYRPLTLLSYAVSLSFSESTAVMRFINLAIHSANAALVFYLISMFFSKKIAYFTSIGFAVLPINSGTVLSLVGRSDLLSAFLVILSIVLFFKEKYMWSSLGFFFALLAKEFSIFLLPVFFLLSLFFKKYNISKTLKITSYYSLVLIPYFILRYLALGAQAFKSQSSIDPINGPLAFINFKERILTSFVYFYFYLRKTFIPIDLSPDYSFNQVPIPKLFDLDLIIGLTLLSVILWSFFKKSSEESKIPIILFLVPFGIISSVVFVTTGTFAERWWYFPSIGLFWFISVLAGKWLGSKSAYRLTVYPVIFAIGFFYMYISFSQAKIWTNEKKLFIAAAQRSPDSAWARTNLAAVYFKEKKIDLAKKEIERSLEISDKYPAALNIYAKLKWQEGEFKEAESAFKRALEYDLNKRNNRDLFRSLAILKLETKNYSEAYGFMKDVINSTAFGDMEKTIYLDNLLLSRVEDLAKNKISSLSESETKIVEALIAHVRGF